MRRLPIGIFDSGVGGLTVARAVMRRLPNESLVYVGDTARVPYGPRGAETVTRFALQLARFIQAQRVKAVVIACNTISAIAPEAVRAASPVPVVDVIAPTVATAAAATRTGCIGVIGTVATVTSGIYPRLLGQARAGVETLQHACPMFVPIAEENLAEHQVADLMAEEYLHGFRETGVDTLILGCTHYPLLKRAIGKGVGPDVRLIDSAEPTAEALANLLAAADLLSDGPARYRWCVSDPSYKFLQIAGHFLGRRVEPEVEAVTLE
jgi:glutamate racemase